MKVNRSQRLLVLAISATVACILQIIALIRYVQRLPGNWLGIALYGFTIAALAVGAAWAYIGWAQVHRGRRTGEGEDE